MSEDQDLTFCIQSISVLTQEYGWETYLRALSKLLHGNQDIIPLRGKVKDILHKMEVRRAMEREQ